jgi:long-subunit fatty acid transport protein
MRMAVLALALAAAPAAAQNVGSLNRTGSGARAAGMANAFIAVSDDGTAASWNPAGLAQLRRPEASVVVDTIARSFDYSGFLTPDNHARYDDRFTRVTTSGLDFVSLAVPFDLAGKPFTVQGGWRRLYELRAEISADFTRQPVQAGGPQALRLKQDNDVRGNIDLWSLSAAARLSPRASVGLSVDLWRGDWTGSELRVQQALSEPQAVFRTRQERSRMRGANVAAGLLLSYARGQVGLVYHAPFESRFDVRSEELGPQGSTGVLTTGDDARLAFGHSIGLGGAFRPRPRLTLALDFTWDQWSRAELRAFPGSDEAQNFFDLQPRESTSTRDTLSLNLGAEWLLARPGYVVPLRFGLGYEPQGSMDPILRDPLDFVMVAAGAGFNTNRFKFDAALQYRFGRQRVSEALTFDGVPLVLPDAYGVLRTGEWRFKVSGILRVTEDGAIGRLLGKIF